MARYEGIKTRRQMTQMNEGSPLSNSMPDLQNASGDGQSLDYITKTVTSSCTLPSTMIPDVEVSLSTSIPIISSRASESHRKLPTVAVTSNTPNLPYSSPMNQGRNGWRHHEESQIHVPRYATSPQLRYDGHSRALQNQDLDKSASRNFKLNLPQFNGKGKWTTFIRQFEVITVDWHEEERLRYLLMSLQGDAADFAFDLDGCTLRNYHQLVDELERRFFIRETRHTCTSQFYNRHLRKGETVRELAVDLKQLIRKAYPVGLNRSVMEDMLIKQFFDGLDDEDARYFVEYLKRPRSLDEAVELLLEYDAYRGIRRETKKAVRSIQQLGKHEWQSGSWCNNKTSKQVDLEGNPNPSNSEFQKLMKAVSGLTDILTQYIDTNKQKRNINASVKKTRACYRCGKTDHFQKNCPEKKDAANLIAEIDADKEVTIDSEGQQNLGN